MRIDVYHHFVGPESDRLERIEEKLDQVLANQQRQEETMSREFDELTQQVSALTSVGDSMSTLLSGLAAEVRRLKEAPTEEAIDALGDMIEAKTTEWAAAVAANTPAEEPAEEEPEPVEEPEPPAEPSPTEPPPNLP